MATLTFQHRWLGMVVLPVLAVKSIEHPSKIEYSNDTTGGYTIVPVGPIKITLHDGTILMVELAGISYNLGLTS